MKRLIASASFLLIAAVAATGCDPQALAGPLKNDTLCYQSSPSACTPQSTGQTPPDLKD